MRPVSARSGFAMAAAACAGLLAFGYYLQFAKGLEPCPLCILQRLAFMAFGVIALLGVFLARGPVTTRVLAGMALVAATLGAAVAGRQVWLQSLPADRVPACGPGLDYMVQNFPLLKTLSMVLRGSGECAENIWRFLGLGIAAWALVWFVALAVLSIYLLRPSRQPREALPVRQIQ